MMIKMDAIITAAGRNSRMIEDFKKVNMKPIHKLSLKIDDKPIIVHTIDNILKSDIDNVIVALGHYKIEIYDILEKFDLLKKIDVSVNSDVDVALSKTIENAINFGGIDKYYLYMAADQPTVKTITIDKMINTFNKCPDIDNTISILARRKTGHLDSAEGLGMPFCCSGKLLYDYIINYNGNLNPVLREMIDNNVQFYGIKATNELELENINHYKDYEYIKKNFDNKN